MTIGKLFLLSLFVGLFGSLATTANAACTKNIRNNLPLRVGPSSSDNAIALIPKGSCRFAVETTDCRGRARNWCRASYDGKFGWINTAFTNIDWDSRKHTLNYYALKAIYERVAKRSGRGYHLHRTYSQDLNYSTTTNEIKRFYYAGGWVFPEDTGKTMCVAAVAEVLIEALNLYSSENNDFSFKSKLPSIHWRARAKSKHLRQHIWEYDGLGSKGAGHALERFNIGKQKDFHQLIPGDTLKFSRNRGPGHSTVFLSYLDENGKVLEAYSNKVKGFHYFSAQAIDGYDLNGQESAGLGFRSEFFSGTCPATANPKSCKVIRSGRWGPNMGSMFSPESWGEIGSNYRKELAREAYFNRTGAPIDDDLATFINSGEGSWLENEVDALLERELDPNKFGNFSTVND